MNPREGLYGSAKSQVVLGLGEARIGTGYARILDGLLSRLARDFPVAQAVISPDPVGTTSWPTYIVRQGSAQAECRDILHIVQATRPALVLINHDPSIAARYAPVLHEIRRNVRLVMHCPTDSPVIDPGVTDALLRTHCVVTYTRRQESFVKGELDRRAAVAAWSEIPRVTSIPVGIDREVFRPYQDRLVSQQALLDRRAARRLVFGTDKYHKAFIVLNANRNILRKRIDLTVEAFAKFAEGKPSSVLLWLHMAEAAYKGWDLARLVESHHLGPRVIRGFHSSDLPSVPLDRLVLIYNACDVGVNTSSAEGWGLVSLEHGATGAAQIIPSHSALPDVWGAAAVWTKAYRSRVADVPHQEEWTTDADDVAAKLGALYESRPFLLERSAAALAHTGREEFDWNIIMRKWTHLLLEELRLSEGSVQG